MKNYQIFPRNIRGKVVHYKIFVIVVTADMLDVYNYIMSGRWKINLCIQSLWNDSYQVYSFDTRVAYMVKVQ